MLNRRRFLQAGVGAAALFAWPRRARGFNQSPTGITKFAVPLPGLGPSGIPALSPNQNKYPGTDYYEVVVRQFNQQLHPNLGNTTFWGFADARTSGGQYNSRYLGGVIVATRDRPVRLKVFNKLPATHILPVDPTLMDPMISGRMDRISTHLHGGFVGWTSDGGPAGWFSNPANGGFLHGRSFLNGDSSTPGAAIYDYPNAQSARMMWYHDHADGITRLNAYAGIATGYLITDDSEAKLINSGILPNIPGYPLGIPLVIQDKTFTASGSLWYPDTYEPGRWELTPGGAPGVPSVVPEFFSDVALVNGAPYPFLPVTPRRFRFRILNGSQARFYNLQLYVADRTAPDGINLRASTTEFDPSGAPLMIPANAPGPKILQIGNEGGFLPAPALLNNPPRPVGYLSAAATDPRNGNVNRYNLLLAPAERADIIVDFRGFENQTILLYNDAPAPFPGGDNRNDYFAGAPDLTGIGGAPSPQPGAAPDTRVLMQFRVAASGSVKELSFDATRNALSSLAGVFAQTQPSSLASYAYKLAPMVKTLNEDVDSFGRLRQRLGSPVAAGSMDPPTEVVNRGEVQKWQIYNLTGDTHPMHFHLVNVQLLKREAYGLDASGNPVLSPLRGTSSGPDPNETGWKETVRMNPGEVTTLLIKFDMPKGWWSLPSSPRYGGAEYVWHCHILEHEEHDMMRPLVVT